MTRHTLNACCQILADEQDVSDVQVAYDEGNLI